MRRTPFTYLFLPSCSTRKISEIIDTIARIDRVRWPRDALNSDFVVYNSALFVSVGPLDFIKTTCTIRDWAG